MNVFKSKNVFKNYECNCIKGCINIREWSSIKGLVLVVVEDAGPATLDLAHQGTRRRCTQDPVSQGRRAAQWHHPGAHQVNAS